MFRRLLASVSAGLLSVALLGGCGNSPDKAEAPAADGPAFPVTVEHVHGNTTIESEPARVVTLASADQDAALSLGVVPVGAARESVGGAAAGSTPWFDAELKKVGGDQPRRLDLGKEIDVAAIKQLDPDLILSTGRVLSDADFDGLSEIAPVVAGGADGMSWQNSLDSAGHALGKSDEADRIQDATDSVIEEGAADQVGMEGTSFIFGRITPGEYGSFGIYTPRDAKVSLMKDFGLVEADVVKELDGEQDLVHVNADQAASLKSEILLLLPGKPKEVLGLESNLKLSRIPALNAGRAYAELNKTLQLALNQPSSLSIPRVIEKYLPDVALISDF